MSVLQGGVWPVMLTPFSSGGEIDWNMVDLLTDWYISSGVSGLFAVCLSNEMYHLTNEERLALAQRVVCRANGRVPVVASGTFGGTLEERTWFVKQMSQTGVDGVVIIVCQLAGKDQSDEMWKANVEILLESTKDVPMGLYECPKPYHRLLSPELMGWCASTGRFYFLKETSAQIDFITQKIEASKNSSLRFLNANTHVLLTALQRGGDGYCGVGANFFPDLYVWLCERFESDPEKAVRLHRFLSIAQKVVAHKYKVSAKCYLRLLGLPLNSVCRDQHEIFLDDDLLVLDHLKETADEQRTELGIKSLTL